MVKKKRKEKGRTERGDEKCHLLLCLQDALEFSPSLAPSLLRLSGRNRGHLRPGLLASAEMPRDLFHIKVDQKESKLKQADKEPAWKSGLKEPSCLGIET